MKNNRKNRYILSCLSGVLLFVAFPYTGSLTALVFVAWIPLLLMEDTISEQKYRSRKVFIHAYLTFLIYNVGSTWWIAYADLYGALLAFTLNALLMATTFQIFHVIKKKMGTNIGSIAFFTTWIAFEYCHYHWELSHPWLTLGNVFSIKTSWIQWYEYTGVFGGTLWILLVNFLFFRLLKSWLRPFKKTTVNKRMVALAFVVLLLPLLISLWIYQRHEERGVQAEIVVVQPNIDPYQKFSSIPPLQQVKQIADLAQTQLSANTKFVLAPETAMPLSFDEEKIDYDLGYQLLNESVQSWKTVDLFIGAATERRFNKKNTSASKYDDFEDNYVEYYNSSVLMTAHTTPEIVHKSKLVLGAEKVPFIQWLPFLESWSLDMGGTTGTLGIEPHAKNNITGNFPFTPSICYESIYGEFTTQQTKLGSQAIFIITNDGWWGDTPGYQQHFSFARLRAIENRKSVARSANTGISGFINQRGDVLQTSSWWKTAVLRGTIFRNDVRTFYMIAGDMIGKCALIATAIFIVFIPISTCKKRAVR